MNENPRLILYFVDSFQLLELKITCVHILLIACDAKRPKPRSGLHIALAQQTIIQFAHGQFVHVQFIHEKKELQKPRLKLSNRGQIVRGGIVRSRYVFHNFYMFSCECMLFLKALHVLMFEFSVKM